MVVVCMNDLSVCVVVLDVCCCLRVVGCELC